MSIEVKVPTLGESVSEATVGQWLKKPGEAVALDEPIVSLETDKVAVEVPSPVAGVLGQILVAEGETVTVGALLGTVEDGVAAAGNVPVAPREEKPVPPASDTLPPAAPAPAPAPTGDDAAAAALSPAVRRAVLEHGIDPSTVKGTGKDGRLTKEDVLAAAQAKAASPAPAATAAAVPASVAARAATKSASR
jgi:2-oxoglutarate dehydrogenase E2 component (dihydrolipoamide succinyltransferase)